MDAYSDERGKTARDHAQLQTSSVPKRSVYKMSSIEWENKVPHCIKSPLTVAEIEQENKVCPFRLHASHGLSNPGRNKMRSNPELLEWKKKSAVHIYVWQTSRPASQGGAGYKQGKWKAGRRFNNWMGEIARSGCSSSFSCSISLGDSRVGFLTLYFTENWPQSLELDIFASSCCSRSLWESSVVVFMRAPYA